MDGAQELVTERLLMRRWERSDREPFAAMTIELNLRSQAVMQRIGMSRDPADDFVHPLARPAHLRRHVLYRLSAGRR